MNISFRPATRQGIHPLIGLMGLSGGGKTLSALLMMRGLVGPTGRIGLIDTDNKRGSFFADMVPGGYDVLDLAPPFSPARLLEVADEVFSAGFAGIVWDSFSDEWDGEQGYLECREAAIDRMAGNDWRKRDKVAMAASAQEKPAHNRLIRRILRANMPVILCFRGKAKVKMEKDEQGKTKIEKPEHISSIQDSEVIYKMLIAGEVYGREDSDGSKIGGYFRSIKHTHPDILKFLPRPDEQIGIKHGELIAKWANNPGPVSKPQTSAQSPDDRTTLKRELWSIAKPTFGSPDKFEAWLRSEDVAFLGTDEALSDLPADRLKKITDETKKALNL